MRLVTRLDPRRLAVVAATAALVLAAAVTNPHAAEAATSEGLLCDTNAQQTFSLTAQDGYVSTPDGNSLYMWSYGNSARGFQLPGPTLCVEAGKAVTVVLHNTLPEATSIVFPGQKGVKANGNPAQPQLDPGGSLTSLVQSAAPGNGSVTYTFTAWQPGHLPLRERHRRQQAGADGPVRRTRRAPRRPRRPGERPRRLGVQPGARVRLPAVRGRPRPAPGRRAVRADRLEGVPASLLHDQRAQHAGHAGAEQRLLAAEPAVRRTRAHPPLRRGHQPAAGRDPLPQRRDGQLPVPPARQRRARGEQGRPSAAGPHRSGPGVPQVRPGRAARADRGRPDGLARRGALGRA